MSESAQGTNTAPDGDPMPQLVAVQRDQPNDTVLVEAHVHACLIADYTWHDIGPATGRDVEYARQRWEHLTEDI